MPLFLCMIRVQYNPFYRYICVFIMLIIGLSDVLDGYIARKRNEISFLGKCLDPIADKMVIVISCLVLSSGNIWPEPRFPYWLPTIIICKDLLLIFGSVIFLLITGEIRFRPSAIGKIATFSQIMAVISVLIGNHLPLSILIVFWKMTIIFTLTSGFFYTYRAIKQL
ncbi:MAG: CDP-alcohol phosphatidyltransferase family protein [Candidatus Kuenenia sp.]|nr:CDP-alcohol phosphatidyltransferase family protein [Candidatus Kuenenia hertensis]